MTVRGTARWTVQTEIDPRPKTLSQPHNDKSFSPLRLGTAAVMTAWAFLFWFLLVSGRSLLYLSTRTRWVVPMGAAIMTVAALGRLMSARSRQFEPLTPGRAFALGVVVLPVVVILALPPVSLGSYAAARRSSFSSGGYVGATGDISSGDLTLPDIAGAMQSGDGRRALARRAGDTVAFTGFVTKEPGTAADEFALTRFMVSCCVADALSIQVRVVGAPPGAFKADDWVRVKGAIYPLAQEAIVDAASVEAVDRPKHPYLNS